jgi:hypothetical protein
MTYISNKLQELKSKCEEYDSQASEEILTDLNEKGTSASTKQMLRTISEKLLHSDFDEIINIIDNFIVNNNSK